MNKWFEDHEVELDSIHHYQVYTSSRCYDSRMCAMSEMPKEDIQHVSICHWKDGAVRNTAMSGLDVYYLPSDNTPRYGRQLSDEEFAAIMERV